MQLTQETRPNIFNGPGEKVTRMYHLSDTNVIVTILVSVNMPPVAGRSIAKPDKADLERDRARAISNGLMAILPTATLNLPSAAITLSERELQVMDGLRQGRVAKEIAAELNVNASNIHRAIKSVLKKVDSRTTEQAIYKLAPRWLVEEVVESTWMAPTDAAVVDG